jgi:hypothetical protein
MGNAIWKGWRKSGDPIPEPTGPIIKRDGTVVLASTILGG